MLEIVCLEPSRKSKRALKQTVGTLTSLGGYMLGSILIGMYIDEKFFNSNGISVVVAAIIGIIMVVASIIRLVILSRDT